MTIIPDVENLERQMNGIRMNESTTSKDTAGPQQAPNEVQNFQNRRQIADKAKRRLVERR